MKRRILTGTNTMRNTTKIQLNPMPTVFRMIVTWMKKTLKRITCLVTAK